MKYSVLIEHDPESGHYTGTVSGLPVVVDAKTEREALRLAREAIQLYLEDKDTSRGVPHLERPLRAKVVTV